MNIEIYRIPIYEITKYLFNAKIAEVNEPMDIMCSKFCAYICIICLFLRIARAMKCEIEAYQRRNIETEKCQYANCYKNQR